MTKEKGHRNFGRQMRKFFWEMLTFFGKRLEKGRSKILAPPFLKFWIR